MNVFTKMRTTAQGIPNYPMNGGLKSAKGREGAARHPLTTSEECIGYAGRDIDAADGFVIRTQSPA